MTDISIKKNGVSEVNINRIREAAQQKGATQKITPTKKEDITMKPITPFIDFYVEKRYDYSHA